MKIGKSLEYEMSCDIHVFSETDKEVVHWFLRNYIVSILFVKNPFLFVIKDL